MKLFESRHRAQNEKFARRTFLKAVSIGLSVPVALQMSRMAVAAPSARPSRLFLFFLPHGAPNEHFHVGDEMDLAKSGQGILDPLTPYKKYLTVLRGVGIQTATNHAAIRSVLTGKEGGSSIDSEIAGALKATPHVLGVQNFSGGSFSVDAQLVNHGGWVTPTQDPRKAADDLFAGLSSGGAATPSASVDEATFRNKTIDLSIGEVEAMQKELSVLTSEKTKLQIHLDALRALKESVNGDGGVVSCDTRPDLPAVTALGDLDVSKPENFGKVLDAHLEAAAKAMLCGTSRIITLQNMYANAQISMKFPGGPSFEAKYRDDPLSTMNHHDPLSHSLEAEGRKNFAITQKWFYSRLAEKFLSVLDQTDPADPEHTVLDNTTVLTCTEVSDGNGHQSNATTMWVNGKEISIYLPWVLIGRGAGLFPGNRAVQFNNLDHRHILAACAKAMGVELTSFGGLNVSVPSELTK